MERRIRYCSVCNGIVPKKDVHWGWVGDYIEGALWCDCTEPSPTIEDNLI